MKGIAPPPTHLEALSNRLKALAEPKRLLILHMLMEGVQCNCELGEESTESRIKSRRRK